METGDQRLSEATSLNIKQAVYTCFNNSTDRVLNSTDRVLIKFKNCKLMSQKHIFHSIAHTRLTSASRRPRTHIINIK